MRYIDSGRRDPGETVGRWLETIAVATVAEIRWQTGFFRADALGLLLPFLDQARRDEQLVRVLIGSNDCNTSHGDIGRLLPILGLPRPEAQLGVVAFSGGAYFHPKVIHLGLRDGAQVAYVGSANLTASGLASLHVEAGVLLNTRDGDAQEALDRIKRAIDAWFDEARAGLTVVETLADVDRLLERGILSLISPPRSSPEVRASGRRTVQPRLNPLLTLPPGPPAFGPGEEAPQIPPRPRAAAPRDGFPDYLLFEPNRESPTHGPDALTGASLPGDVAGLIIRLNRDSGRHFFGGAGTSNLTVPVATVGTIRFGIFQGKYRRPRAEFPLMIRHLGQRGEVFRIDSETNVMAYGFLPGESGHGDIRMLIPAAAKTLADALRVDGHQLPTEGDVALLEWPTPDSAAFRITYLDAGLPVATAAAALFDEAGRNNELVGEGACWLPQTLSPVW